MRLAYIKACGFRGIKDELNIPFSPGFSVITGRNGSGKSTICDALEFVLTGTLEKYSQETEKGESIADYLRWRGTGTPADHFVEIGFRDSKGNIIKVRRNIPDGEIVIDGNLEDCLCHAHGPKDRLKQLCRTSIIRDETITRFSLDLSEFSRYEFVKDAIGIADLGSVEQKLKQVLDALSERVKSISREYEITRGKISSISMTISEMKSQAMLLPDISHAASIVSEATGVSMSDMQGIILSGRQVTNKSRQVIGKLDRYKQIVYDIENELSSIRTDTFNQHIKAMEDEVQIKNAKAYELEQEKIQIEHLISSKYKDFQVIDAWIQLINNGKIVGLQDHYCPLCDSYVERDNYNLSLQRHDDDLKAQYLELSELQKRHQEVKDALLLYSKSWQNLSMNIESQFAGRSN